MHSYLDFKKSASGRADGVATHYTTDPLPDKQGFTITLQLSALLLYFA